MYEGNDYLVVKSVVVDRLPASLTHQKVVQTQASDDVAVDKNSEYANQLRQMKQDREARRAE